MFCVCIKYTVFSNCKHTSQLGKSQVHTQLDGRPLAIVLAIVLNSTANLEHTMLKVLADLPVTSAESLIPLDAIRFHWIIGPFHDSKESSLKTRR